MCNQYQVVVVFFYGEGVRREGLVEHHKASLNGSVQ